MITIITKTIYIGKETVKRLQKFLDSEGKDKVYTVAKFTADFGVENGSRIEADIKVCQGDPPYVDAVLFSDGCEIALCEPDDTLLGEYCFYVQNGEKEKEYKVIVEQKMSRRKLPNGTKVKFNIGQDLDTGKAVIIAADKDKEDDHLYYKLDVYEGSQADMHRNSDGELWVNDFEVKPTK